MFISGLGVFFSLKLCCRQRSLAIKNNTALYRLRQIGDGCYSRDHTDANLHSIFNPKVQRL